MNFFHYNQIMQENKNSRNFTPINKEKLQQTSFSQGYTKPQNNLPPSPTSSISDLLPPSPSSVKGTQTNNQQIKTAPAPVQPNITPAPSPPSPSQPYAQQPQQNQPASAPPPSKKNPSVKKAITLFTTFILLLFFSFASFMAVAAYTDLNIPLINNDLRKKIKIYTAKLPLLPKTPEQVFLAATSKAKTLFSFDNNLSLSIQIQPSGLPAIGRINLDGDTKMSVEYKNESLKIKSDFAAALSILDKKYSIEGNYVGIDSDYYLRFTSLPLEKIISDLQFDKTPYADFYKNISSVINTRIINRWIVFKSEGLNTEARKEIDKNKAKLAFKSFYADLIDQPVEDIKKMNFKKTSKGYEFYKSFSQQELIKLIKKSFLQEGEILTKTEEKELEEILSSVEYLNMNMVISKDYYLKKLILNLKMNYQNSSSTSTLPNFSMDMGAVFSFSNFNQPMQISPPPNATPFTDILKEIGIQMQTLSDTTNNPQAFTTTSKIRTSNALVEIIENYRRENGRYPKTLAELGGEEKNLSILQSATQMNIVYIVSGNSDAYLVFFPNTEINQSSAEDSTFYVIKNGKVLNKNMSLQRLTQEIDNMQKQVLGAYTNALAEYLQKIFQNLFK